MISTLTTAERECAAYMSGLRVPELADLDDCQTELETLEETVCKLQDTIDSIRKRFSDVLEFVYIMHDIIDELDPVDQGPCLAAFHACEVIEAHLQEETA